MASSGFLRRVALVRTDVSKELSSSFIRVTRLCELATTLTVTSNRRTLRRNTNGQDKADAEAKAHQYQLKQDIEGLMEALLEGLRLCGNGTTTC
jgi:hypothetical protein